VVLEPDRYPTLRFRLGALRLEAGALPDGGSSGFTAQGELTLHGVTRPLTVPGTATREGDRITADAAFDVRLSEYDLMRPRLFFVVVEDTLPLTVHLVFAPAGPGG
jgi:polyisoprenoid-binding protein YceI